jgi:hypothetical protein
LLHSGDAMDLQVAIAREKAPQRIGNLTEFHKTGNHQRTKVAGEVSARRRRGTPEAAPAVRKNCLSAFAPRPRRALS